MSEKAQLRSKDFVSFVTAGKACFTLLNTETGNRFTYKVKQAEDKPELYFVSVLNGPDNWSNYLYLGIILDNEFRTTAKTKVRDDAPSLQVFKWFWKHVEFLPKHVQVWHEGKCGRCGRKLTVPDSIASGFGPECIQHMG